ncbi:protein OXIDATIVE STRESS 3 LIKE 2-like [Syzygium oleosum]|uniref:protein OXIDATIVE STRESS 3 LIKE 2-like n=1 Tax=Syzygium oleosum TaxID=219896 RepID=UPI0024B8923C|nr:protein OXIDATIVE STRESS 3 LIKE 2-like [Syzygium oleosum]
MCASAHPPEEEDPEIFFLFSPLICNFAEIGLDQSLLLVIVVVVVVVVVQQFSAILFCLGGFLVMIRTKMGGEKQSFGDTEDPKLVDASGGGGGERYESESSMGDSLMSDESSSCSSSELAEDASSSTLCSSSSSSSSSTSLSNCRGPLYELSELMTQLPIKRGLSKFYQGKSQSFTSLARVQSIEDLVKKENPYRKRLKTCESFAGALDKHSQKSYSPRPTISKKSSISKGSFLSSSSLSKIGPSVASLATNPSPVVKTFHG